MVRANHRWRDAAIRRALGAGAADLFCAVITENLLIALGGGAVGVFLAYAGVRVLVSTAPIDIPRLNEVHLSLTTLLFALGISVGAGAQGRQSEPCTHSPPTRFGRVPGLQPQTGQRTEPGSGW